LVKKQSLIAWQKDGSWRLRVETAESSGGDLIEQAYIEHPGAVVIVPLRLTEGEPEVLMLRQYRLALGQTILELPAGTRGWEEEWLACAQRELREETGFRAESFTSLGEFWPAPGLSSELMRLFVATGLLFDPLPQDADEEIEVGSYHLTDLVTMAWNGRLRDAKSIIGILKTADYLRTFTKKADQPTIPN
jgi:ADP-ribose pyrophosphatase